MDVHRSPYPNERVNKRADPSFSERVDSEVEQRGNVSKVDLQSSLLGAGAAIAVAGVYTWWTKSRVPKPSNLIEVNCAVTKPLVSKRSTQGRSERPQSEAYPPLESQVITENTKLRQPAIAIRQEVEERYEVSSRHGQLISRNQDTLMNRKTSEFRQNLPTNSSPRSVFQEPMPYDRLPTRKCHIRSVTRESPQAIQDDLGISGDPDSMIRALNHNPWAQEHVSMTEESTKDEVQQNSGKTTESLERDDLEANEEQFFEAQDQPDEYVEQHQHQHYFNAHCYEVQIEQQTTMRSTEQREPQAERKRVAMRTSRGYLTVTRDTASQILFAVQPIATNLLTYGLGLLVVRASVNAGYERYLRDCDERDKAQQRIFNEQYERYNEDANARIDRMDEMASNKVQDLRGIVQDLGKVLVENTASRKEHDLTLSTTAPNALNTVQISGVGMAQRERRAWRLNKLQTVGSVVGAAASVAAAGAACSVM